jgi:hypothetical protein
MINNRDSISCFPTIRQYLKTLNEPDIKLTEEEIYLLSQLMSNRFTAPNIDEDFNEKAKEQILEYVREKYSNKM